MTHQKLIGSLYSWGADPDRAIQRVTGDEEFYLDLVLKYAEDLDYKKVREYSESGNLDEAFMLVHRLKGSSADLSLTPLFKILDEMTETLRPKKQGLSAEQLDRFEECAKSFLDIIPKDGWRSF